MIWDFLLAEFDVNGQLGRGENRTVTELGFAHVTTKTWAYSRVFGFFRKNIWQKNCSRKHMKYANTRICVFSGSGTSQGPESNPKAVF